MAVNLSIGVFQAPPRLVLTKNPETGRLEANGIMGEIIRIFSHTLGFSYTLVQTTAGEFGVKLPNGTWNGLMGRLKRKELDFEAVGLIPSAERVPEIDFTTSSIHETFLGVIISNENQHNANDQYDYFFSYAKPFSIGVWLTLLSLWIAFLTLSTATRIVASISGGKLDGRIKTATVKIPSISFFLTTAIVFAAYNSVFIASVAVKKQIQAYQTIEDLMKDGSFKFGINPSTIHSKYIEQTKSYPFANLWKMMLADSNSFISQQNFDLAFKRIVRERFVFLFGSLDGSEIRSKCNMQMLPQKYFSSGMHIGLTKNSPFTEHFSRL